jgi:hypothetical protein
MSVERNAVIDGPPPGALRQLIRRWRRYIGWWMLEKLSPPEPAPRRKHIEAAQKHVEEAQPSAEVHELPTERRASERWRAHG